ncbi:hypothetical protein P170DRAFT_363686 [Aspergillus steynii IBT 23096]|uniref:Uncharacterized protein n=1 Tax=Aspergillus steynii IBT 23096 TaxID=1392250 RepID=A0A2I2G2S0_9EURO|nr:uncharacterized protein P170DRAFT_363686 [Aspergillus steynii IBT 23096]PLB47166.1 hypothetical protein P170DRAFT_363686 [Aspergillus steynii IBT 23096]
MPAGPMDALGAFSHLSENLPQWITRLSELATYTAAKRAEYAEDFRKHAVAKPRRRKNSSICSIRTDECVPDGPTQLAGDSKPISSRIPRKRSTDEASIDNEDDDRYSYVHPRHNLIIQYDGHTQKSLEEMVRYIGTARNNIRRGRMSQLPLGGFRSRAAFGRGGRRSEDPRLTPSAVDTPEDQLLSNIRSARARNMPGAPSAPTPKDSSFDLAEKHLEIAHSMCETAAYQFLRSGDCSTQLSNVEDKFKHLLDIANKEVTRLQAEQSNSPSEEDTDAEEELAPVEPVKTEDKPPAYSGEIEVDDGTASVESLDLTAFRASRLRRC